MDNTSFNEGLFDFLKEAPTSYHAVRCLGDLLDKNGFVRLDEQEAWSLETGKKYYVIRNDAALIAFTWVGDVAKSGFRMIGAHTDSPGLKVKPCPETSAKSFVRLGVEVYGGPILNTWFDRELSMAGRLSFVGRTPGGIPALVHALVDFREPVAIIPNLAIHLNRDVNDGKAGINKQNDLPPLVMLEDRPFSFVNLLKQKVKDQGISMPEEALPDFDIMLYDPCAPSVTGLNGEFITSGRLDNLVSCYCSIKALLESRQDIPALVVLNDHEEVGSLSTSGASGNFLSSVLTRLCRDPETFGRCVDRSLLISADNAHGVHPNFGDKYDPEHSPVLNRGPVLKYNANQRYATDSRTGAAFRYLCARADVPCQEFVVRSDMPCGSTIGPLTAGNMGVKTLDAGIPMLAMHSIRETAGSRDAWLFYRVLDQHLKTWIG